MMTMGELIRYHRKQLGISQEALGQMLNPKVNKAAVSKWEKGNVENIKRTHIQQLAKKFGLSPCELMSWEDVHGMTSQEPMTDDLIALFVNLNNEGKEEVLKYAQYIASQKKYESIKKESKNA
jgi:transcriptional regulator with XRE-family HTH domain